LPDVAVVLAGFPCTDLSQVGRAAGISGDESGLIFKALDLVQVTQPQWVVLENVPNLIHLHSGTGLARVLERLEAAGYDWAYRVIDSEALDVPQRRRRVYIVAARTADPAAVLFRDDVPSAPGEVRRDDAFGFYWTEGNRGLGWAVDAVPPLKGGSKLRVPSPPAVWLPHAELGQRIVRPSIEAAEILQGFEPGWTLAAEGRDRWKLAGNAVTVPVAQWIAEGIQSAGSHEWEVDRFDCAPLDNSRRWPRAAYRAGDKRWSVAVGEWPRALRTHHLRPMLEQYGCEPLSRRAAQGFRDRLAKSRLKYDRRFMEDLDEHIRCGQP
jgi:DNA (cytosine-5)-methyltransferase 1